MCFTSTSALSDEFCAGSSPFSLIELLGHQPFCGCCPGTAVCVREAESRLCSLHAKDEGAGSLEQGWEVSISHSECSSQDSSSVGPGMLGGTPWLLAQWGRVSAMSVSLQSLETGRDSSFVHLGFLPGIQSRLSFWATWCAVE